MVRMFFFSDGQMAIWNNEHLLTTLGKKSSSTQSHKVTILSIGQDMFILISSNFRRSLRMIVVLKSLLEQLLEQLLE